MRSAVSFTATVRGSEAAFNRTAYKHGLGAITGVAVDLIQITTSSSSGGSDDGGTVARRGLASLLQNRRLLQSTAQGIGGSSFSVIATILAESADVAAAVSATIQAETPASLSAYLGASVSDVSSPTVDVVIVYPPPSPAPLSPPLVAVFPTEPPPPPADTPSSFAPVAVTINATASAQTAGADASFPSVVIIAVAGGVLLLLLVLLLVVRVSRRTKGRICVRKAKPPSVAVSKADKRAIGGDLPHILETISAKDLGREEEEDLTVTRL